MKSAVTVGASTPKTTTKAKAKSPEVAKPTHTVAKKPVKPLKVETKALVVETKTEKEQPKAKVATVAKATPMTALVLQKLVLAIKGKKKGLRPDLSLSKGRVTNPAFVSVASMP